MIKKNLTIKNHKQVQITRRIHKKRFFQLLPSCSVLTDSITKSIQYGMWSALPKPFNCFVPFSFFYAEKIKPPFKKLSYEAATRSCKTFHDRSWVSFFLFTFHWAQVFLARSKEFNPPLSWSLIALDACIWAEPNVVGFLISMILWMLLHFHMTHFLRFSNLQCFIVEDKKQIFLLHYAAPSDGVFFISFRTQEYARSIHQTVFLCPISHVRNLQWRKMINRQINSPLLALVAR